MEMLRKSKQEVGNSGVYRITCVANNHFYYGSSVDIGKRFANHLTKLRAGNHRNKRLQRIFLKYGEASLNFEVVAYCDKGFVLDVEQGYLDEHVSNENCVNFCKSAKAPMAGLKFSNAHKRKMSESQIKNKYIFYYGCGKVECFDSLKLAGDRFGVKRAIVSKWFKRKDLGRSHGILQTSNIVKAEKQGEHNITLLPWDYKQEPWVLAGASSKSDYYRRKRTQEKRGMMRSAAR